MKHESDEDKFVTAKQWILGELDFQTVKETGMYVLVLNENIYFIWSSDFSINCIDSRPGNIMRTQICPHEKIVLKYGKI